MHQTLFICRDMTKISATNKNHRSPETRKSGHYHSFKPLRVIKAQEGFLGRIFLLLQNFPRYIKQKKNNNNNKMHNKMIAFNMRESVCVHIFA